jgi:hypothetical protein
MARIVRDTVDLTDYEKRWLYIDHSRDQIVFIILTDPVINSVHDLIGN